MCACLPWSCVHKCVCVFVCRHVCVCISCIEYVHKYALHICTIYIHTYMHTYIHIYSHERAYTRMTMCEQLHSESSKFNSSVRHLTIIYVRRNRHRCINCTPIQPYMHISISCAQTHMHMHIYIYIYIHTYIHAYIHTHTHTHIMHT